MENEEKKDTQIIEGEAREIHNTQETALIPAHLEQEAAALMPIVSLGEAKKRYAMMVDFVRDLMIEDKDFGTIPGTNKPTLYKPGAEKLTRFFGMATTFELVEKIENFDTDNPLFFYKYRCVQTRNGVFVSDGFGSANSFEDRYRWRWVEEHNIPEGYHKESLQSRSTAISEFAFALEKKETEGKYGKPESYWKMWDEALEKRKAKSILRKTRTGNELDAFEIKSNLYRVPNPDIFTLVNTIDKIAQKRSFVACTLIAVNASEFFTQDIEDIGESLRGAADSDEPWEPPTQDHPSVDSEMEQDKSESKDPPAKTKPTGTDRPIPPERLKARFDTTVAAHKGTRRTDDLQQKIFLNFKDCVTQSKDPDTDRHAVQLFLTGKVSLPDWTGAELMAALKWMDPRKGKNDKYHPNILSAKEFSLIVKHMKEEA